MGDATDLDAELELFRHAGELGRESRWLKDNLARSRWTLAAEAELLASLGGPWPSTELGLLLDASGARLDADEGPLHDAVADLLVRLMASHDSPGKDSVAVDRIVRRLLRRLRPAPGRPVALECLGAERRARRSAAWTFYRKVGLDPAARTVALRQFNVERNDEFLKVLLADRQAVAEIGLEVLLPLGLNRYWRSVAIESQLESAPEELRSTRDAYPAEWLWAVGRANRRDLLDDVIDLVTARSDDVFVVNRTVLCLESLKAAAELDGIREQALALADASDEESRSILDSTQEPAESDTRAVWG